MSEHKPAGLESGMRTVEATMDALADGRRRELLTYLLERDADGSVEVETLADHVSDGGDGSGERAFTRLRHVHLPHLADAGFVSYERGEGTVRLADDASLVEDALDAAETFRSRGEP